MRYLIAILIYYCFSLSCFAQLTVDELVKELAPEIELSKAEMNILKQELKIQTLILESIKEMELDGVEFKNISKVQNSVEDLISTATRLKAFDLGYQLKEQTSHVVKETIQASKIEVKLSNLKKYVLNDLSIKKRAISSMTRRFGMEVGIFYLVAAQVDYTIPLILIGTGNVPLGAALFSTPFSSASTSLFASLKQSIKKIHLLRQLGYTKFKEHFQLTKKLKSYLNRNLFKTDYLHATTIRDTNYLLTLEDSNAFKRLLNRMGYMEDTLNFENLSKFLREEDVLVHKLNQIDGTGAPRLTKMLEIIKEIEETGNIDIMTKMQNKFGKSINLIKSVDMTTSHMRWFIKVANAKSFDDFFILLKKMPEDLPARAFGNAWRNYILPQATKSITDESAMGSYRAFRKLHDMYDKELKSLFIISKEEQFSGTIKNQFIDYLYTAMAPINSCAQVYKMKKGGVAPLL